MLYEILLLFESDEKMQYNIILFCLALEKK